MRKILPILSEITQEVLATEKDARKFDNGNTAAGIRVRKKMQEIKALTKLARKEIQSTRKERKYAKKNQAQELPRT